jgi:hypothetical protein
LEERDAYSVLMGKPGGKGDLKYLSVDGRIILNYFTTRMGGRGLDSLAQDRDKMRAVMSTVMKL